MNLFDQLNQALQTWLDEVFSEEQQLPRAAQTHKVDALLREAQAALQLLYSRLAQAVAQHQRANTDWVQAVALEQALAEALDDDRRAGLQSSAQVRQTQWVALKERQQLLKETAELGEVAITRLQTAIDSLQFRLDQVRKRRTALMARGQLVGLLMELDRLDRELSRDESLVQEGLQAQEAEVIKKEDWLTAREEWKRK